MNPQVQVIPRRKRSGSQSHWVLNTSMCLDAVLFSIVPFSAPALFFLFVFKPNGKIKGSKCLKAMTLDI